MSISAPFLLMPPGVDQPLPPVLVCVSVLYAVTQVGLFTPVCYSGSFLVILLVVVVGNSLMVVGAATRRVHLDMYSTTTRLPALSNTLLWCGLKQPLRKIIKSFFFTDLFLIFTTTLMNCFLHIYLMYWVDWFLSTEHLCLHWMKACFCVLDADMLWWWVESVKPHLTLLGQSHENAKIVHQNF